jgi:hypothetical protein
MTGKLVLVVSLALVCVHAAAATVPWQEGFEGYAGGTTVNSLSNAGWGASSDAVTIQAVTNVADAVLGTNAVVMPEGLTASNAAPAAALSNVWVEIYLHNSMAMPLGMVGSDVVNSNATVALFLATNGWPVVWNPDASDWLVCTQDYWRVDVATFNTSAWARVTMYQNYSNKTAALFFNEHLLVPNLRFINTNQTNYAQLRLDGGVSSTSVFDAASARYAPPTNHWTADLDQDGMLDAMEVHLYATTTNRHRPVVTVIAPTNGAVTPTGPFDVLPGATTNFTMTASNGYYVAEARTNGQSVGTFPGRYTGLATDTWANIGPDGFSDATFEAVFLRKPQLTSVAVGSGGPDPTGGVIGLSSNEVFPGGQATCTMTADVAYAVSSLLTNGSPVATFAGQPRTAFYTVTNIWSNVTLTAVFEYTGVRYVTNDYATLQAAVGGALTGETIVANAGVYTNDVTLDKTLTLRGTNVTVDGALTVSGGATGTLAGCQGLVVTGGVTVAGGGLLVVSNGSVDVGTLTVQNGGTVQVVDATAFVAGGATFTGTFTLATGWDTTVVPQAVPFTDLFERYAAGVKLNLMGVFGWAASDDSVVVQTNQAQSGRAVEVPAMTVLSSSITAPPASNAWIECYYRDTARIPPEWLGTLEANTNATVMLFLTTEGYVTVYNPDLVGWDVCSNDAWGVAVTPVAAGGWPRITINRNLARGRVAVFLDGRLLRQELQFVNANPGGSFRVKLDAGGSDSAWFDTYSVRPTATGIVSADRDQDGWPDAWEIDQFGNTLQSAPQGAVYRFR